MAFELPDLPYSHDALADLGMSKETLEYHHDLHHKAYVDNGNKLISGTEWTENQWRILSLAHTNLALLLKMEYSIIFHSYGIIISFGR